MFECGTYDNKMFQPTVCQSWARNLGSRYDLDHRLFSAMDNPLSYASPLHLIFASRYESILFTLYTSLPSIFRQNDLCHLSFAYEPCIIICFDICHDLRPFISDKCCGQRDSRAQWRRTDML